MLLLSCDFCLSGEFEEWSIWYLSSAFPYHILVLTDTACSTPAPPSVTLREGFLLPGVDTSVSCHTFNGTYILLLFVLHTHIRGQVEFSSFHLIILIFLTSWSYVDWILYVHKTVRAARRRFLPCSNEKILEREDDTMSHWLPRCLLSSAETWKPRSFGNVKTILGCEVHISGLSTVCILMSSAVSFSVNFLVV